MVQGLGVANSVHLNAIRVLKSRRFLALTCFHKPFVPTPMCHTTSHKCTKYQLYNHLSMVQSLGVANSMQSNAIRVFKSRHCLSLICFHMPFVPHPYVSHYIPKCIRYHLYNHLSMVQGLGVANSVHLNAIRVF
jgi:hypothetical protein